MSKSSTFILKKVYAQKVQLLLIFQPDLCSNQSFQNKMKPPTSFPQMFCSDLIHFSLSLFARSKRQNEKEGEEASEKAVLQICMSRNAEALHDLPQAIIESAFDNETAEDALMMSCRNKDPSCCFFLLKSTNRNTFLERLALSWQNALHIAIQSDNEEQVRALQKVKPSLMLGSDCNQQTPLHTAVLERKPAMLPILFPHSDVSLLDSNRQNAIHISIKMESSLDFPGLCATVFQALCLHHFLSAVTEQGMFFNFQKCEGAESLQAQVKALHLNLEVHNRLVYRCLVKKMDDFNFSFHVSKETPLVLFSQGQFSPCDVAQMFLDRGALDIPNGQGLLPAVAAATHGNLSLLCLYVDHLFSLGMGNLHALPMALFMKNEEWGSHSGSLERQHLLASSGSLFLFLLLVGHFLMLSLVKIRRLKIQCP